MLSLKQGAESQFRLPLRSHGAFAMTIPHWSTPYIYIVKTEFGTPELEAAWNEWYNDVHVADMLTVPGVRGVKRYVEVSGSMQYVAIYEIESPEVFDHPRYREVTGWGEWHPHVRGWTRTILRIDSPEEPFAGGAAVATA